MTRGPLLGRTILVTRSIEQAGPLVGALAARGAEVVEAPVIALADPDDWGPADEAIGRLAAYDWILFTSVNAVERFVGRMELLGVPVARLVSARLAAVGSATAERLRVCGLEGARVPEEFRAEGLLAALRRGEGLSGKRLLLPRAAAAREVLVESLRAEGAVIDVVPVYRTVPVPLTPEVLERLGRGAIDMVTFTSSSTVTSLLDAVGGAPALRGVAVAVIGPVTAATARRRGLEPAVVAARSTIESLVEAIVSHHARIDRGASQAR